MTASILYTVKQSDPSEALRTSPASCRRSAQLYTVNPDSTPILLPISKPLKLSGPSLKKRSSFHGALTVPKQVPRAISKSWVPWPITASMPRLVAPPVLPQLLLPLFSVLLPCTQVSCACTSYPSVSSWATAAAAKLPSLLLVQHSITVARLATLPHQKELEPVMSSASQHF